MSEDIKTSLQDNSKAWILGIALFTLLIHLYTNLFAGYGIFRDELYYIACSNRLAAGYVDQPPLSILILAGIRALFGQSLFALRLLPAFAHALTVILAGLLARRMGGGKTASALAALGTALAPICLGFCTIYSMNSISLVLWSLGIYLVIRVLESPTLGRWIALGIVMGLGLLNKVDFLWFAAGFGLGILLTAERRRLKTIGPYAAAILALLIFSPFILWNASHGFPHLEFIRSATAGKYSGLTRLDFLTGQILLLGPVSLFLWLPGLYYLLLDRQGKRFRILGIIFLTTFFILLASGHSKSEYLAPAFPMLFAAGGILWERRARAGRRRWMAPALAVLLTATGLMTAPMAVPILPVETYIRYSAALGVRPGTAENKELAELPQYFADMFGWEDLARDVSTVYLGLTPDERASAVVLTENYGEAGTVEYYGRKYPLPPAFSIHNNYWFWGPPAEESGAVIAVGLNEIWLRRLFLDIKLATVHSSRYAMPYENKMPIFVCRGLKQPWKEIWRFIKNYG